MWGWPRLRTRFVALLDLLLTTRPRLLLLKMARCLHMCLTLIASKTPSKFAGLPIVYNRLAILPSHQIPPLQTCFHSPASRTRTRHHKRVSEGPGSARVLAKASLNHWHRMSRSIHLPLTCEQVVKHMIVQLSKLRLPPQLRDGGDASSGQARVGSLRT